MNKNLAIGARLKDALQGPCRYFLFATGVFAVISSIFLIWDPVIETGSQLDYPWRTLISSFVIPIAITKALLLCVGICFFYKLIFKCNANIVLCLFILPFSLFWSFLASNHSDLVSFKSDYPDHVKMYRLYRTFDYADIKISEERITETITIRDDDSIKEYDCDLGYWWRFSNFSKMYKLHEKHILENKNLRLEICQVSK